MQLDPLHRKLRQFIGQRFDYLGEIWVLIEVLGDNDTVVLRRCIECQPSSVQQNAYGEPTRRASGTLSLPISSGDHAGYSQDILLMLEGRQSNSAG